jgi:hypothetical protein
MDFDKQEILERLRLEIEVIERGGYHPSVREPRKELRIFRDSVTCLNMSLEKKLEPCDRCFLIQYVPPEHRDKEEPCHYIPLNERGDTIAGLRSQGLDSETIQSVLLEWLYRTTARLETELARSVRA